MRSFDNLLLRAYSTSLLADGGGNPDIPADALAVHADREGIAGLLLELPALAQPQLAAQRAALQAVARQAAVREMAGTVETRQVLSLLIDAGVEVLVLKGAALACWLYREPWHRPRSDLDVLVPDKASARQAVALLCAGGYRLLAGVTPDTAAGFEVALQRGDGIVIDLHWGLLNTAVLERCFSYAELDAAAKPLSSLHPGARGLGGLHALFHALLHRVTNLAKGDADRLIWLYDIDLLAKRTDSDQWQTFLRLCAEKRIATPCLDGLNAAREALGTAIPRGVREELAELGQSESWQLDSIDQGAVDRSHLAALLLRQRVAWLRRKLFPSPEFMRHRYGASGRLGLVAAYLTRWRVAVRRTLGRRIG